MIQIPPRVLLCLAVLAAPTIGVAQVVNSSLSGILGDVIGNLLWGAVLSNMISFGIHSILSLFGPGPKETFNSVKGSWQGGNRLPFLLIFVSGFIGAYFIAVLIIVPTKIGFSAFFVSVCVVQMLVSLILEFTGFLWTVKKKFNAFTVAGVCIAVAGAIMFQVESSLILKRMHVAEGSEGFGKMYVLHLCMALLAGIFPLQTAIMVKFTEISLTPFRTVATNQLFSCSFSAIVAAILEPHPNVYALEPKHAWLFLGGVFTAGGVTLAILLPGVIGYPALLAWVLLGQLLTSYLLDSIGALGRTKIPSTVSRIFALIILFLGVVLVQVSRTEMMQSLLDRICWKKQRHLSDEADEALKVVEKGSLEIDIGDAETARGDDSDSPDDISSTATPKTSTATDIC